MHGELPSDFAAFFVVVLFVGILVGALGMAILALPLYLSLLSNNLKRKYLWKGRYLE